MKTVRYAAGAALPSKAYGIPQSSNTPLGQKIKNARLQDAPSAVLRKYQVKEHSTPRHPTADRIHTE